MMSTIAFILYINKDNRLLGKQTKHDIASSLRLYELLDSCMCFLYLTPIFVYFTPERGVLKSTIWWHPGRPLRLWPFRSRHDNDPRARRPSSSSCCSDVLIADINTIRTYSTSGAARIICACASEARSLRRAAPIDRGVNWIGPITHFCECCDNCGATWRTTLRAVLRLRSVLL